MHIPPFVKTKLGLLLLSTLFTLVLFISGYETVQHLNYYRWREAFGSAWIGKTTVPSSNPVLMWEYRPDSDAGLFKTNRYGFHDRDYQTTVKPVNTLRIAFVGDSVTVGMTVPLEQTYFRQFETLANQITFINQADPDMAPFSVQTLGFAIDGYHTGQISELVRAKVLSFTPDKVVYVMCLNDFDFDYSSGDKMTYFKKPTSFFWLVLEHIYMTWRGEDFLLYHYAKNKDEVFTNILAMRDLLTQEGIAFQVVVLPTFPRPAFTGYPLGAIHEGIASFLAANDIRHTDLLDAFVRSGSPLHHFASDGWHPNVQGHLFIARHLLRPVLVD